MKREHGKEFVGTGTVLWGITAGVYLALMGPWGMRELSEGIMQRAHYAARRLAEIRGVRAPVFKSIHFKEFVVNFDGTGKTVREINEGLLDRGIFGGESLKGEAPGLGESALYCITELHNKDCIDRLVDAIREVVG